MDGAKCLYGHPKSELPITDSRVEEKDIILKEKPPIDADIEKVLQRKIKKPNIIAFIARLIKQGLKLLIYLGQAKNSKNENCGMKAFITKNIEEDKQK